MFAQALWDLSTKKPLSKITVTDVIEQAGTARQTFYDYFSDKDALLDYVLDLWLSIATKGFPDEKTWLQCLQAMASFVVEHKTFFLEYTELHGRKCFSVALSQAFSEHITQLISTTSGSIDAALERTIVFYGYGLTGAFSSWIRNGAEQDANDMGLFMYEGLPSGLKKHLGDIVIMQPQQKDKIEAILASRNYLYQVFRLVFGTEPTQRLLKVLSGEQTREALELFRREPFDNVRKLADYLDRIPSRAENPDFLETLKAEYAHLFMGPGKLPAYPCESAYGGREAQLPQENMLEVRKFYAKYGYRALASGRMNDDHIGIMLDFMANMSQRTYAVFHDGSYEKMKELINAQRLFLDMHLCNWLPRYAKALRKQKSPLLYAQCATALCTILETDKALLSDLEKRL